MPPVSANASPSSLVSSMSWPRLSYPEWKDTCETLHMWTQIVGKTRLQLSPFLPQWWNITLYLTSRGLTTSPMPYGDRTVEVQFDFIDHLLKIQTSDGEVRSFPLRPRTVADFYRRYRETLSELGVQLKIYPVPVEVVEAIPFAEDRRHTSYDADSAHRFWQILSHTDSVFNLFRGEFLGKVSPSHFFWGSFDLAVTRFSGRPAPVHPGGAPNCPNYVMREAYSQEVSSAGFWPGNDAFPEPAFYSYAYPAPTGFNEVIVRPSEAYFHSELGEFILPYEAVRTSSTPSTMLLDFLRDTYDAAAKLAHWNRAALDRPGQQPH